MTQQQDFLYLSDDDLAGLGIGVQEVIDAIEAAVRGVAAGVVWTAPKVSFLPGDGRYMMATLAASDTPNLVVVKSVMVAPDNPARGLPAINGAIMLLDSQTGALKGVIGANWVTAVRTAGISAVMAKRLANPEARSIAFVGTGVQAHSHLDAFCELYDLQEVRVFGRGRANIDKLCQSARAKGLAAQNFTNPQDAIGAADIVVSSITLNYDVAPFLDAAWMQPGSFAVITDLAIPWKDDSMAHFDRVFVDDTEQEKAMEKPMVAPELITGDLQSLVAGPEPVAFRAGGRAAFVFRGLAVGDFAIAGLAYQTALANR